MPTETMTIAIQPDAFRHKNGEVQSFSARWIELAKNAGVDVRVVDVYAHDLMDRLRGCDGFLWRFNYSPNPRLLAKRLLPAVEQGLGIPVFPDWPTAWHFEDKIAQHYLLAAAGIPAPRTWVFWEPRPALEFLRTATYPLVLKLSFGFQSRNVRLLSDADEGAYWVGELFGPGLTAMPPPGSKLWRALRRARAGTRVATGGSAHRGLKDGELQHGYFFAQEFLAGNTHDTRVTVIGNRAYAFRRFNRPDDFRASGSGRINWDPAEIGAESVRLGFRVARALRTQVVALDVLRRGGDGAPGGGEPVVIEISYTFASWAIRDCPGHWELSGDPDAGEMKWVAGPLRAEDAIFEDFLALVRRRRAGDTSGQSAVYSHQ